MLYKDEAIKSTIVYEEKKSQLCILSVHHENSVLQVNSLKAVAKEPGYGREDTFRIGGIDGRRGFNSFLAPVWAPETDSEDFEPQPGLSTSTDDDEEYPADLVHRQNHLVTQELNDLGRDLELPKSKYKFLGS
ncbi:hypothetical protein AVEN_38583-1 [Araneus ventricosus]|uniref:Uncharacterized protein n=1 Tax=Araneus ventricosus TaxID=182803 RepID=A0A4Y2TF30_ARAVE|nr:hypothetical protein AVEN_38583-1 [Araneus ventricosus]